MIATPAEEVDIAIVGAGPGGAAAAISLARAGRQVYLLERKAFPRDKVCGGCLSHSAVRRLRELLGADAPLPGVANRRVTFVMGNYHIEHQPRPDTARLVPRRELDACLARTAAECGAQVAFQQTAHLVDDASGWQLQLDGRRIRPRHLLWAAGLAGLSSKIPIANQPNRQRLISQQWIMPPQPPLPELGCVQMHWLRGGYVGLATPEPNTCVVALAALAPRKGDPTALEHLYRLNPQAPLWNAIPPDAAVRYGAQGCGGFPWRPQRLGDRNLVLVGDAAGFEEPFSGEGIGQALYSGMMAAQALCNAAGDCRRAPALYTATMARHHRWIRRRTQLVSHCLHHPLTRALSQLPPLLPTALTRRLLAHLHTG